MNNTNENCVILIKKWESLHDGDLKKIGLQPKMCPAGVWTEGYGEAMVYNGKFLKGVENEALANSLATIKTEEDADKRLRKRITERGDVIRGYCDGLGLKFDDNKFGAIVSFAYNCGNGAAKKVLTSYKGGIDMETLLMQYRFATINGVKTELRGLLFRRKAEVYLFKNGVLN